MNLFAVGFKCAVICIGLKLEILVPKTNEGLLLSVELIEYGLDEQWEDLLPRKQSDKCSLSPYQERDLYK